MRQDRTRSIPNTIRKLVHCALCDEECPENIAYTDYAEISIGFTEDETGFQVRCLRHNINILLLTWPKEEVAANGQAAMFPVVETTARVAPPRSLPALLIEQERKKRAARTQPTINPSQALRLESRRKTLEADTAIEQTDEMLCIYGFLEGRQRQQSTRRRQQITAQIPAVRDLLRIEGLETWVLKTLVVGFYSLCDRKVWRRFTLDELIADLNQPPPLSRVRKWKNVDKRLVNIFLNRVTVDPQKGE